MKEIFGKNNLLKKALVMMLIFSFASGMLVGCGERESGKNKVVRLSTTTSVNDSGLLPYLQMDFQKDTGYTLEITSAGTGAAIEKGTPLVEKAADEVRKQALKVVKEAEKKLKETGK